MKKVRRAALCASALVLICALLLANLWGKPQRAEDFQTKLEASMLMQTCMDKVKEYKAAAGLAPTADDIHKTGMIGEPYTGITTTNGALEAKRTTADADMAALVVQLLTEAGVKPGDRVGAGFSGSFPAMDLAVVAACQAMDVELVFISSVGASTYGANQPELTFPDMVWNLAQDGIISHGSAAVSLGGQRDCGLDMDPELVSGIRARIEDRGERLIYTEDFEENLALREQIYKENGPITCFIGVGGNLTTSGLGENELSQKWGVIHPERVKTVSEKSGLLERYNASGLYVIHLLNIKKLVADYGLPFDPEFPSVPGESAVYYTTRYPWAVTAGGMILAAAILILDGRRESRRAEDED